MKYHPETIEAPNGSTAKSHQKPARKHFHVTRPASFCDVKTSHTC